MQGKQNRHARRQAEWQHREGSKAWEQIPSARQGIAVQRGAERHVTSLFLVRMSQLCGVPALGGVARLVVATALKTTHDTAWDASQRRAEGHS